MCPSKPGVSSFLQLVGEYDMFISEIIGEPTNSFSGRKRHISDQK
jgi:hypothetical protein